MSSPCEQVRLSCPPCGEAYETWIRRSMNLTLDPSFDDAYLEEMSTGTCPRCGHKVRIADCIVTEKRGKTLNIWPAPGPKRPRRRKRSHPTDSP
jgi:predicted RNA-binding Zn-ribbon protein involved in translation (DUF1610 family)